MNRNRMLCLSLILSLSATGFGVPAFSAESAGVVLDDSIEVGDQQLVLNGIALRKKAIFKVYVAGLYLPARQSDPAKILAEDSPRRLTMQFVRSVTAEQLSGAWDDCLTGNLPKASDDVKKSFAQLNDWMSDVGDGDRLTVTYVPGVGTDVELKGANQGTVEGKNFADAIFSCWLGPEPPSDDLKTGLLGK